MKVLVYGAGVIGCYLTHVLCRAGNDVTLLARGEWKQVLEDKGLIIRHHLQRKTTVDHPRITGKLDTASHYDAVFSVMPLAYLAYGADCDYKKTTKSQRRLCMDASVEGYDLLLKLGYSIVPEGDDAYYRPGTKRRVMQFVIYVMSKTVVGELMAAVHCRHAGSEMETIDNAWTELRRRIPDFPMPNWDALRGSMLDWAELHQQYESKEGAHHDGTQSKSV